MMTMQKLNEFTNGDKRAVIYRYDNIYTVDCFIGGIIISKESSLNESQATILAENFIGQTKPTLLNENA